MKMDSTPEITSAEIPIIQKRILIVEDEAVFARAVEKKLGRAGYLCEIAGQLSDARKSQAENPRI